MSDSNRDRASSSEDYHKKHVGGCRKLIYDPQSSPCTCESEYDRESVRADANERWLKEATEREGRLMQALEYAAGELIKAERPIAALALLLDAAGAKLKVSITKGGAA